MLKKFFWLDGEWVEAEPSLLQSLTPGVLMAKGVFETMRVTNGKVALLEAHLKRMSRGLKVLEMGTTPFFAHHTIFEKRALSLLKVNRLKNARVRLMVWQKGAGVHYAIIAEALQPASARQYAKGFKAMLTNGHRRQTPVPIKSLDYKIFRESLQKAHAAGFDEAIFLNHKGELVEGSRTNIFLVKDNCILTPPIASGCLPGVTRQVVLDRARRLKIRCLAKTLNAQDLFEADEAFVTNVLLRIMPLTHIGQKQIGTGKPGPVTRRLARFYTTIVAPRGDNCSVNLKLGT